MNQSWILGGSTSTALYHIKQHHIDKLTAEELYSINKKAQGTEITSPTSRLPARTPPHSTLFPKIKQNSTRGRDLNIKLMLAMISSSVSFNILDNPEWGIFVESLSGNQYHLPCRQYMNGTIVPAIYSACKTVVTEKIKTIHHIALTTDCWKSFAKQSYITLTCHIIDHDGKLQNILLSTTEIKTRHTSENLREHIKIELVKWGLESSDSVVTNFNSTNNNDIEAETEDSDKEVDYLQEVGYYREEDDDDDTFDRQLTARISDLIHVEENPDYTQMSKDSTHMSQESTQMSEEETQMSQEETDRSHARNVILKHAVEKPKHTLSFTTDKA